MKKTLKIQITILVLAIISLAVYFIPMLKEKQETMMAAKIKTDTMAFTHKALEEFKNNKGIKASSVAQKIVDEFNEKGQNPVNKNLAPYTFNKEAKSQTSVEYDDMLEMIILTSYDKKGTLTSRTVIKPPSFVTYESENK